MLLTRRVSLGAAVLIWAVIVYAMCGSLIVQWIDDLFQSSPVTRRHGDDPLARLLPLWETVVIAGFVPLGVLTYPIFRRIRKYYRERHDLCPDCGRAIEDWHGHCPGCGVRLGPDSPRVVHVLRTSCR